MNKDCYIAKDLLPLNHEGLLHEETASWLKEHLASCDNCREYANSTSEPIENAAIPSPIDNDKMFANIYLKLAVYQIIFVTISFFFALITSLLNNHLVFVLTYAIFGFVLYLFYKHFVMVTAITFLPNFIWSLMDSTQAGLFGLEMLLGAAFLALIHLVYALVGSLMALLLLKWLKEVRSV